MLKLALWPHSPLWIVRFHPSCMSSEKAGALLLLLLQCTSTSVSIADAAVAFLVTFTWHLLAPMKWSNSSHELWSLLVMYGQITVLNQVVNAYFQITFGEWNWVWIDGILAIVLAYTLPLARSAPALAKTRPTASILGLQTVVSAVGTSRNIQFAMITLFVQSDSSFHFVVCLLL